MQNHLTPGVPNMENPSDSGIYLSPAKLNLGLKIVGRRDDGYHLLNTVFCLIDLFDRINIQALNTPTISLLDHTQSWSYTDDLGFKAAKLLQDVTGCKLGANIKIDKVIPSGAGLGGGSSNAATVLTALNSLWHLDLTCGQLIDIGRKLGADVPFFIYGKNAYASGIGDQFSDLDLPQRYFVLVKPDLNIPTKEIFDVFKLNNPEFDSQKFNRQSLNNHNNSTQHNISEVRFSPQYLLNYFPNDLQDAALALYPQLGEIIKDINSAYKINVAMTGSGSTVFMSFDDLKNANKVALSLRRRYNTYLVKSINVSPAIQL